MFRCFKFFIIFICYFLLQKVFRSVAGDTSEATQNVSNVTRSTAHDITRTETISSKANSTQSDGQTENMASSSSSVTDTLFISTIADALNSVKTLQANVTEATTTPTAEISMRVTKNVESIDSRNWTASAVNITKECTIRNGWLFWRKIKIPAEQARFNAKKCELQYCTPSLKIETFTCENLISMIVPPVSTEELINSWKLECAKHKCIPPE